MYFFGSPVTAVLNLCMEHRREKKGEKRGKGGRSQLLIRSQHFLCFDRLLSKFMRPTSHFQRRSTENVQQLERSTAEPHTPSSTTVGHRPRTRTTPLSVTIAIHVIRRRENVSFLIGELCLTAVTQNFPKFKKNKRHAVADPELCHHRRQPSSLPSLPVDLVTIRCYTLRRERAETYWWSLLHVDEREGAKTRGRRISLLLPSFDAVVAGMLPTCTRHLATENGDDAWLFRDDGKSNNEVQSRDFKVEKSRTGFEHGMVARISHYFAAGCALGG
nr:hypothetical protein Iba_chr10fCG5830 [Ipomoea batatas]